MARPAPTPALLASCPERVVAAEQDGERFVLLRPRFRRGLLARWLQPLLKRPHLRVHLDEIGSFVWERCDGHTSVAEIADAMTARFGARVDPARDRLALFLDEMRRGGLILLRGSIDISG